ncbi:MAG TPA: DUF6788 family protein [Pseudonocardiaceae bacterium]|jgi:hypothetical protein|nr:DUF6788 family protein [Pseudonocardiaceae bacterium]
MTDLGKLTSVQLRVRRRRLAGRLGDPQVVLAGSLVSQSRRCGKPGCRCAGGEEHGPYTYLSARVGGVARLRYVPAALLTVVRRRVKQTEVFEAVIAEIAAINLELLARRELD